MKRYGGTERVWLPVCCDGLPYGMILGITQAYTVCKECQEGFLGMELFNQHTKTSHKDQVGIEPVREFDWVVLRTGDGHYEMNLMKAFVELNWDVFHKMLAQKMGWKSEMALKCAKQCYDNHKTWQILMISTLGLLWNLCCPMSGNVRWSQW